MSYWLPRLRIPHKALLGACVMLLPIVPLLYLFTVTVNQLITATALERCGIAYDAHYRRLLAQLQDGAPPPALLDTVARMRALDAQPCPAGGSRSKPSFPPATARSTCKTVHRFTSIRLRARWAAAATSAACARTAPRCRSRSA